MFVYLSKKIAIPNNVTLSSISWNNDQGWIAAGGEDGLLKVLKLENQSSAATSTTQNKTLAETQQQTSSTAIDAKDSKKEHSNLTMNQTLEGHDGAVQVSTWNPQHRKLTTADSKGLIIVWILYDGMWYEEMVNNRGKSRVTDLHWNKDGSKIGIIYEDGAVIVGSVDGNRLWGKELKNTQLSYCQWSPDSKVILFATSAGELQLFDASGTFIGKLANGALEGVNVPLAGMDWYNGANGYLEPSVPCLAISYETGRIQILRSERDTFPMTVDTNLKYLRSKWNPTGSILAVSGVQVVRTGQGEVKEICIVHFYDPYGKLLRSIKVPGKRISSISWEYTGLRIVLAVDSYLYFANVRPDYTWTHFAANVLLYTYNKPDRPEQNLVFWNLKTSEKFVKFALKVYFMISCQDHCLIGMKPTGEESSQEKYLLTVCNGIGTSIDTRRLEFEPRFGAISKSHAFASSANIVIFWQFRTAMAGTRMGALDALRKKNDVRERCFFIDDASVVGVQAGEDKLPISNLMKKGPSSDPIVAITASDAVLIIARSSGTILQFLLPSMTFDNKYAIDFLASSIALNSSSTRVSMLDGNGNLRLLELERKVSAVFGGLVGAASKVGLVQYEQGKLLEFERKDVGEIQWSTDNPESFCTFEKSRLVFFHGTEFEEPVQNIGGAQSGSTGYITEFSDLTAKLVLLDDVLRDPENPPKEAFAEVEMKILRDTRGLLESNKLAEALKLAQSSPCQKLWRVISNASLEALDFGTANKAMVKCSDYEGLQFIKKLQKLDDKQKQKAEIESHFGRYDAAEKLYLDMDRRDLAMDLRIRLGDWFRVVQLIKTGSSGDDSMLENAWEAIGDYHFDRQRWTQAVTYYAKGRITEKLVDCYYFLEDFDALEKLIAGLSESSHMLKKIAEMFVSVGLCGPAVAAFVKSGDIKTAIDSCIILNQWNLAMELAEKHQYKDIGALLSKYANYLVDRKKIIDAIELYRKASDHASSAKLLFQLADDARKGKKNLMAVKQLYVLAALEVERYHQLSRSKKGGKDSAQAALDGLLAEDSKSFSNARVPDTPWRGAEGYHFLLLAQRQYYQGDHLSSMKTCLLLQDYEDVLDPRAMYAMLALSAYHAGYLAVCSKAFIKLEALEGATDEEQKAFEDLAFSIFRDHAPKDPKGTPQSCPNCGNSIPELDATCTLCSSTFPPCMASGTVIVEGEVFTCMTCKHRTKESEIEKLTCCPLCHSHV